MIIFTVLFILGFNHIIVYETPNPNKVNYVGKLPLFTYDLSNR